MEFKRDLSFGETLRINLEGDFTIILKSSIEDNGFTFQSDKLDDFNINYSSEFIEITNKYRSEQQREDLGQLISQLDTSHGISGIIQSGISSIQKIIEGNHAPLNTNHAKITLTTNEIHTKNIFIKSSNTILQADHLNLSTLKLKSGNAKINIQENNSIEHIKLNASNMKGTLFFGEKTPKLKIEANNGKIDIVRQQAFEGLVACNGNNLKASGYLGKSSSVGLCDILMNNGKISIRS